MEKEKEIKKPKCGFACLRSFEGQKDFDQDYVDYQIKKVVKKIGESEDDYILEDKVIISKRPIKEVIDSQAAEAGIEAFMKPYLLSGEDLPEVKVDDKVVQDFTKMPETLAEAAKLGETAKRAFLSLDPKLRGDAKTPEEFLKNLTQEKFNDYLTSLAPKAPEVKEEKKDETK